MLEVACIIACAWASLSLGSLVCSSKSFQLGSRSVLMGSYCKQRGSEKQGVGRGCMASLWLRNRAYVLVFLRFAMVGVVE